MSDLPEGTKSFVEAVLLGGDVDEHEGFAVTAQGVLEQVRQLGVAVRNVRALHRRNRLRKSSSTEYLQNPLSQVILQVRSR
jgi:hypothetical protein